MSSNAIRVSLSSEGCHVRPPFRPKSLAFPTTKFAPKRPDARTVGSGDPALAKTIGKIAKEMHVSSEDEPMPSSVKVILMNAMKVSAEEKKRRKEKIERSSRKQLQLLACAIHGYAMLGLPGVP